MSVEDRDNPCAEIHVDLDYRTRAANSLHADYPILWEKAQEFDFAERLGGCSDPLLAEIDRAMNELWQVRRNAEADRVG